MSEGTYESIQQRFSARGLQLNSDPSAAQQQDRYPVLQNVRSYADGTLRPRPGYNSLGIAPAPAAPWHTTRRLVDKLSGTTTYVAGIGTALMTGTSGAFTSRDTGYSGNPLTLAPFKPDSATDEWMAVADSSKMRKIRVDGTVRTLGLPRPTVAPYSELDMTTPPLRIDVDNGNTPANWTHSGAVVGTTISRAAPTIPYAELNASADPFSWASASGWFTVPLSSIANIGPGTILQHSVTSNTVFVERVLQGSPSGVSCTVERVISDGGSITAASGWMTIVPSVSLAQIKQHAYIRLSGIITGTIATHVMHGPDGKLSFRCYVGLGTVSPGDTLTVQASVYGYISGAVNGGGAGNLSAVASQWATIAASTTHTFTRGSSGSPLNLNLSSYSSGGRAVNEAEDEVHVSFFLSNSDRVTEMKIQADLNAGDFTTDALTHSISPADLLESVSNRQTRQEVRRLEIKRQIQNRILQKSLTMGDQNTATLDNQFPDSGFQPQDGMDDGGPEITTPGDASTQGTSGSNQWFEVRFKLSDWERVGESPNVGLRNIIALRFTVITNSGGTVDFAFDNFWIGGGYEPDVAPGAAPYEYRYRYRDSSTGTRSNWSPPSRSYVWPHRYQVRVICVQSITTGVDKIDVQRRGGTVNEWVTIGSIANSTVVFYDTYSDTFALGASAAPLAVEGNVHAQPFTIATGPLTIATGIAASGTSVYDATGRFNISWEQGTELIANGVPTLIYKVVSANVMELYDHVGSSSSCSLEIPKPLLTGQPLPVISTQDLDGWRFALGDSRNPGRLYFFNRFTLDSTQGRYWIDVTDGSDPLMNVCVFNTQAYVWSAERMFLVHFSGNEDLFRADPVAGGVGMYARWAMAVGDAMYWLGKDGIYVSDGGAARNITRRDLSPLFSNEGQTGADTNGIAAPSMPVGATLTQQAALRLEYAHDKWLYFDYLDGAAARRTLLLDRSTGEPDAWGWWYDTSALGIVSHYADEGEGIRSVLGTSAEATPALYTLGGAATTDNGQAVVCRIRTLAVDAALWDVSKLWGDVTVDCNPGGATITPTLYFDDWSSNSASSNLTGSSRPADPVILDPGPGVDRYARNLALDLQFSVGATQTPVLYGWSFSVMGRPKETTKRHTDYSDLGHWGPKELKGVSIECDTESATKTVLIEYTTESGTAATISKSITAAQKTIVHVAFDPVICYEARLRPTDTSRWRLFGTVKWHFEPLTDLSVLVGDWMRFPQCAWVQGVEIDGDTNNVSVSTVVQRDFNDPVRTITAQHNGRGTKAYSFDPPFIAYMVRTAPAGAFRRLAERWIWQPEAPIGTVWEAQEFELGDPYGFAREVEVEYAAGGTATLLYYVDGVLKRTDAATLVTTGGTETFRKVHIPLPASKGRLGKFRIQLSSGIRVRHKGTLVLSKPFAGSQLQRTPVLGAPHNESGAQV